jgi:hypothetical protein
METFKVFIPDNSVALNSIGGWNRIGKTPVHRYDSCKVHLDTEAEMSESHEKSEGFFGAYFDRDSVLRLSRWADAVAWVVLTVYLLVWLFSVLLFVSQFSNGLFFDKGMNFLNAFNVFKPYLMEPLPGVFYFFGLQGVSKALLILLDMEDNTRRASRK